MTLRDHVNAPLHRTNRAFVVLFLVVIALPLVLTFSPGTSRLGEQDGSAWWPGAPTTHAAVWEWPTRAGRWFQENYALRRELIRTQGALVVGALGTSPSPVVLLGKAGWWFYRGDGGLEDMMSIAPLTRAELDRWTTTLEHNNAWLAKRSIPYLFVLAPDKHQIYPEFLPDSIHAMGPPRLRQLTAALQGSTVATIDLQARLLDAKPFDRLYHQTDTHWNQRGALVAFLAIAEWLARVHPGARAPTREDFDRVTSPEAGRDIPAMLGLDGIVREKGLDVRPHQPRQARVVEPADGELDAGRVVTEKPDPSLPRILVFRDSFTTALIPFLAEQCRRCVFLWQNDLDPAVIEREQPDVVIHEIVGRRLHTMVPYDAVADERADELEQLRTR